MNDMFGKKIGPYIRLELLGEGGMATVYRALDPNTERIVAIKVIKQNRRTTPEFKEQFKQEAVTLASLSHPNIVSVLDYGIHEDQPYLVMEHMPRGNLKEAVRRKLPWQTAAAILAPIARALAYVHRHDIVHLDVKPSNILLKEDFTPMLADFGILKLMENKDEKLESAVEAGFGTPDYMAPEQGMKRPVDSRADIYSLGIVFYELVLGQRPYTADSPVAMIFRHANDKLPPPTSIDEKIPKSVEQVILRAVRKDANQRYSNMDQFAEALELIARGDKTLERQIIQVSRQKAEKKQSTSLARLFTVLILLMLGTLFGAYQFFAAAPPTPTATHAATITLAPVIPTSTRSPMPIPTSSQIPTVDPGDPLELSLWGRAIPAVVPTQFQELARWGIGGVHIVRWSPAGKTIALASSNGIFLYEAESLNHSGTPKMTKYISADSIIQVLSFNPDGSALMAGFPDGTLKAWNANTAEPIPGFSYSGSGAVTALAWTHDGERMVVAHSNGKIFYLTADGNLASAEPMKNPTTVTDMRVGREGRFIYVANGSRDIEVWDLQSETSDKTPLDNKSSVRILRMSSDGHLMLAGGVNDVVTLWNLSKDPSQPMRVGSFSVRGSNVADFVFSEDTELVLLGLNSGELATFAVPSEAEYSNVQVPLAVFKAHDARLFSVDISPDGKFIASGNYTNGLLLWNADTHENVFGSRENLRAIKTIYLSNDGLWLASAHDDNMVRIWNMREAVPKYEFSGSLPRGVPFSPDSHYLVFLQPAGKFDLDAMHILDLKNGSEAAVLPDYDPKALVQFTNNNMLLIVGTDREARFWDVATWEQLVTYGNNVSGCGQYFVSQNGTPDRLAVISVSNILFSYDQVVQDMCGSEVPGGSLKYFFPQQNMLIFVRGNGQIWKGNSHMVEFTRIGSSTAYPSSDDVFVSGHQASGWFAYAFRDVLHIENITGVSGMMFNGQDTYKFRVAFSPDAHLMALGSQFGSISIWSMP